MINNSLKGRIRDKVKQVLLIDGTPSVLYKIDEKTVYKIKLDNIIYNAEIPSPIIKEMEKLQTLSITKSTRESKRFKRIKIPGIGNRTTIRSVNGNTHITVGGSDETQLSERIELIKNYLLSLGIKTVERCHWVCSTDKAKTNEQYSYPHKLEEDKNRSPIIKPPVECGITTEDMGKVLQPKSKEMTEHTKNLQKMALDMINKNEEKL